MSDGIAEPMGRWDARQPKDSLRHPDRWPQRLGRPCLDSDWTGLGGDGGGAACTSSLRRLSRIGATMCGILRLGPYPGRPRHSSYK